jgi:hypothetical protein
VLDRSENFLTDISLPAVEFRIYFANSQVRVMYDGTRILSTTDIFYGNIKIDF